MELLDTCQCQVSGEECEEPLQGTVTMRGGQKLSQAQILENQGGQGPQSAGELTWTAVSETRQ